jgi:hypothetical protein
MANSVSDLTEAQAVEANRQKFSLILKEQLQYNTSAKVAAVEARFGPYPFDDRMINDTVPKSVVGPRTLENGATYFGHWYFQAFRPQGLGQ